MNFVVFILLLFASLDLIPIKSVKADNWAVLVAGSKGYYNYRHQADVCHAYQLFHKYGFPNSNIVVMIYDDIAYNEQNPYKGNIINRPNGLNVYPGTLKDYTGEDVNPKNFLNVLKGNITGTKGKKVLESTDDDNVFIYFTDHGASNLIAFPNDYLYADQLNDTLTYMHQNKMYKNLVFYLEACESGSMFSHILNKDMGIYATTAATPYESSYACYLDNERNTYLGDCYSVHWLENSVPGRISFETVYQQFLIDRNKTITSTVCEYGDKSVSQLPLKDFLFYNESVIVDTNYLMLDIEMLKNRYVMTSSRTVKYDLLKRAFLKNPNNKTKFELEQEIKSMKMYDDLFYDYKNIELTGCDSHYTINNDCLRQGINDFEQQHGKFTDYGLKYVKYLAYECMM